MQIEEVAGLGFGLTILLGLSLAAVASKWRRRAAPKPPPSNNRVFGLLCIAPWVSVLFVMTKLNLSGAARYLAPYYPLLIMGILVNANHAALVRTFWWRSWAFLSCGLAALLLIISPARPLWPAAYFLQHYASTFQSSTLGRRAMDVYAVQGGRSTAFAPVVAVLPSDAAVLGYRGDDYPETSLWKPFGSRRILHIQASDSAEQVRQRGMKYLLVITDSFHETWPQWVQRMDARELRTVELRLRGGHEPFVWHLVEINSPRTAQTNP